MDKTLEVLMKNLDFTDSAKQLNELKAMLLNIPETNKEKVELLKDEMKSGLYQIQSLSIAEKLLAIDTSRQEELA